MVVDGGGVSRTYATQAAYQDALNKQANLDLLINTFGMRANPVAISVSVNASGSTSGYTGYSYGTAFGSFYSGTVTVTTVKFATERALPWLVSGSGAGADTNAVGYQFLDALEGIAVADLATPVLNTAVFEVTDATNTNTLAIFSSSL